MQKDRGFKHKHDGLLLHPISVKNHSRYFGAVEVDDDTAPLNTEQQESRDILLYAWSGETTLVDVLARTIPMEHWRNIKFNVSDLLLESLYGEDREDVNKVVGMTVGNDVYLRDNGDAETLFHEIGHVVFRKVPDELKRQMESNFRRCLDTDSGFVSKYAKTSFSEFFAENYAVFWTRTGELRKRNRVMYQSLRQIKMYLEDVSRERYSD